MACALVNSLRVYSLQAGSVVGEVDRGLVYPRRLSSGEGKQLLRVDVLEHNRELPAVRRTTGGSHISCAHRITVRSAYNRESGGKIVEDSLD